VVLQNLYSKRTSQGVSTKISQGVVIIKSNDKEMTTKQNKNRRKLNAN
jgi:hypothetical protein